MSVGNDTYNPTKYNKIQITNIAIIKAGNTGAKLLRKRDIKCNDKINNGNIHTFIRSTMTNSPPSNSGATNLPPLGDSFMYKETSSNNRGKNVFVSFERTDIIQNSNITFY